MDDTLTPQQRAAVENRGGKLLVSAAAGSGKTKVLVDRLLLYMMDPVAPANIDDFLIITFTEAAAAELRTKVAAKLSEHLAADPGNRHLQRQLQRLYLARISTVHGFCSSILREYAYRLDIPADYRVADEDLSVQLKDRAMTQTLEHAYSVMGESKDLQSFLDMQGLARDDRTVMEILYKVFDSAQCYPVPNDWLDECVKNSRVENLTDASETVWGRYMMDAFFNWLDTRIAIMENCARAMEAVPGQDGAVQTFWDNVQTMRSLRSASIWDDLVKVKKVDFGTLRFVDKTNDPAVAEPVKAARKAIRETLDKKLRKFSVPSDQVLADLATVTSSVRGLVYLVKDFTQRYDMLKRHRRVLDFNDLEHYMLRLLTTDRSVAEEIAGRYREVMVDEYQDTNAVQDAIYERLARTRNNLFMVGDVKQAIYQFRQADPQIFLTKYAQYAHADDAQLGEGRKILLSKNFRSGDGVIHAVNDIFTDCMCESVGGLEYGGDEMLYPGVDRIALDSPEVEFHCIQTHGEADMEEADFVAKRILELTDGKHFVRKDKDSLRPITPGDVAIILRSPGSVGQAYIDALSRCGIACVSESGIDLLQTQEGGTMFALLQTISNPRQDIPLLTVLMSPVFAFSADEMASVRAGHGGGIFDAIRRSENTKCKAFLATLRELRRSAAMLTLPQLLQKIFLETRIDSIYGAMEDGKLRQSNLQTFYTQAVAYSASANANLDAYLEHLAVLSKEGRLIAAKQASMDAVTIISIHKSKGLEYPVVFASSLARRFNRQSQQGDVLCDKDLGLGLNCVDAKNRIRYASVNKHAISAKIASDNLSEEMRLLYVALTRARDRLIMTYASKSLEKDIRDTAIMMDLSDKEAMSLDASCPGDWVLYSAMHRTEAGEIFAYGDRPRETFLRESPWLIRVHTQEAETVAAEAEEAPKEQALPREVMEQLQQALTFRYPHAAATQMPSKLTATQPKGRPKDAEAADQADEPKPVHRSWRKAHFAAEKLSGREYGTAIHSVMQHVIYGACGNREALMKELDRLQESGLLTALQREAVDVDSLLRFFASDFGKRLSVADHVLREFKFTILDDGEKHSPDLAGEQVLLQGVVDCAIVDSDGITVLDFKTDKVSQAELTAAAEGYRHQVEIYAQALQRIFGLPVKEKLLYFFRAGEYVAL